MFELLRVSEFCFQSTCYSLPIFTIESSNSIKVTVQTSGLTLTKAHYISCTILANDRTSQYSHQLAILRDGLLHFQDPQLPSLSLKHLKHPDVDLQTRKIQSVDKLGDFFYPIYSGSRVSLQCLSPTTITVDGVEMYCDRTSLQFISFPQTITVDGKPILSPHSHAFQPQAGENVEGIYGH